MLGSGVIRLRMQRWPHAPQTDDVSGRNVHGMSSPTPLTTLQNVSISHVFVCRHEALRRLARAISHARAHGSFESRSVRRTLCGASVRWSGEARSNGPDQRSPCRQSSPARVCVKCPRPPERIALTEEAGRGRMHARGGWIGCQVCVSIIGLRLRADPTVPFDRGTPSVRDVRASGPWPGPGRRSRTEAHAMIPRACTA